MTLCLVPEVPFTLGGVLRVVRERLARDGHAVVVVTEGAGHDLITGTAAADSAGNSQPEDIGVFLRDYFAAHCGVRGAPGNVKYIDPSYTIRSLPTNARDAAFCVLLGEAAVHAGMAGRTDMVVGSWHGRLTHVPIPLAASSRKKVDPNDPVWQAVLAATGQPSDLR